jgi:hypothetical protein
MIDLLKPLLIVMTFASAFIPAAARAEGGRWIILAVNGHATADRTAYVSEPIYYPGYEKCGNTSGDLFESRVKRRFEKHLESRYPRSFPPSVGNYTVHSLQNYGDTALRSHSRSAVADRATAFAAEERADDNNVLFTHFSASGCDRE